MNKKIEIARNLSIILVTTLASVVLVKSYLIPSAGITTQARVINPGLSKGAQTDNQIQTGAKIDLAGVDWAKNGRTLLLAVSDKCHFCSESAPFYQRLVKQRGNVKLLAILPQPVDEGKKYLDSLSVSVDEIRQAPLGPIGIRGTPTLVLVDNHGAAIQSWRGKLTADKEAEVLASVQ
jgi:thioredoxin-related protein